MSFIKLRGRERGAVIVSMVVGSVMFFGGVAEAATITASLDVGSRGNEVILLQTYLAQDDDLYPQKLLTGYFGPLTRAAVGRFQCRENIVCEEAVNISVTTTPTASGYGRVGPRTKARLNELMKGMTLTTSSGEVLGASTGNVGGSTDFSAPVMSEEKVTVGSTFATISWITNESAWSQVFYGKAYPFLLTNAAIVKDPSFDTTNGVTIGNLEPNTTYYYVRESADVANNIARSVVMSFTTSVLGSATPGTVGTSTTTGGTGTTTSGVATTTTASTATSSTSVATTTTSTSTASTTGTY
jgi:peptidoglycan hydrolase-like protein with peptidoglycan-binding domain